MSKKSLKQPTRIDLAGQVIGKRPILQDTDTAICRQCHRLYSPVGDISHCPKCLAEGHIYRLRNLEEARWWVKFYTYWLEREPNEIDRIFMADNIKMAEVLEKGMAERVNGEVEEVEL